PRRARRRETPRRRDHAEDRRAADRLWRLPRRRDVRHRRPVARRWDPAAPTGAPRSRGRDFPRAARAGDCDGGEPCEIMRRPTRAEMAPPLRPILGGGRPMNSTTLSSLSTLALALAVGCGGHKSDDPAAAVALTAPPTAPPSLPPGSAAGPGAS